MQIPENCERLVAPVMRKGFVTDFGLKLGFLAMLRMHKKVVPMYIDMPDVDIEKPEVMIDNMGNRAENHPLLVGAAELKYVLGYGLFATLYLRNDREVNFGRRPALAYHAKKEKHHRRWPSTVITKAKPLYVGLVFNHDDPAIPPIYHADNLDRPVWTCPHCGIKIEHGKDEKPSCNCQTTAGFDAFNELTKKKLMQEGL